MRSMAGSGAMNAETTRSSGETRIPETGETAREARLERASPVPPDEMPCAADAWLATGCPADPAAEAVPPESPQRKGIRKAKAALPRNRDLPGIGVDSRGEPEASLDRTGRDSPAAAPPSRGEGGGSSPPALAALLDRPPNREGPRRARRQGSDVVGEDRIQGGVAAHRPLGRRRAYVGRVGGPIVGRRRSVLRDDEAGGGQGGVPPGRRPRGHVGV